MATTRFRAALVLGASLGLAPSVLRAAPVGRAGSPAGAAPGASLGAAAAFQAPLANLMKTRITADHALARDWAVGQVAAALAGRGVQAEGFARLGETEALAEVDQAVRAMVRETAGRMAAEKDAAANHGRAIDLMKFRAILGRSLDDETRAVLDEAYAAAQAQFAGNIKGEILGKMRDMVERFGGNSLAESGLIHLGDRTPASLKAFAALPGAGEIAEFERRVRAAYGLRPAEFDAAAAAQKIIPAPVARMIQGAVEGEAQGPLGRLNMSLYRRTLAATEGLLFSRPPSETRAQLEGLRDRLADLQGQREAWRRIQSPSFPGVEGALLSYYARTESADAAGRIQALDEQIRQVQGQIDAGVGTIRAKLAENKAEIKRLKKTAAMMRKNPSRFVGRNTGPLHQRIGELERENEALKASLPRSKFRRWLAGLSDRQAGALAIGVVVFTAAIAAAFVNHGVVVGGLLSLAIMGLTALAIYGLRLESREIGLESPEASAQAETAPVQAASAEDGGGPGTESAVAEEKLVLRLSRSYGRTGRIVDVEVEMVGGAPRLRFAGGESAVIRDNLEGLPDYLAALEREREALLRSPADAAQREEVRILNIRIARARQELDSVTGIIRRQLAQNQAEIEGLKNAAELARKNPPGFVGMNTGPLHQRIGELERENEALKASLPRSKFRRWLADVWDATAEAYAKAGEYSIK